MKNCVELRSRDNHNFNYNLGSSGGNRPASAGASGGGGDPAPPNPSSWWSSPSAPGGGSGGGFPSSPGADPGPNPNAFFSRDQGNWYNVPCTKHNLVVCQISQLVPEQVVQLQVVKTKKVKDYWLDGLRIVLRNAILRNEKQNFEKLRKILRFKMHF